MSASTNGGGISLVQGARGGFVSSQGSGDAESRLSFVDGLASSLSVWLDAVGGTAELGGAPGDALVAGSIEHTGSAPVSLYISSNGGSGAFATSDSPATNGGAASIGPVFAGSARGDVVVEAFAFGGQGGTDGTGGAPGADGGSVALVDAIDGSTSGSLSLFQRATGGAGGMSGVTPGRGGDATSLLDVAKSLERLEVRTEAIAGSGGAPALPDQAYGIGGNATSSIDARNDGGSVSASSLAWSGYASDGDAVASGDAMASGYVILDVEASTRAPLSGVLNASGKARIERARGVSTGGQSVSVSATLRQGDASRASGRDGHAAELVNFVEGETSGALNLEQHAF
ncbi:MAG TPA: hypothetical protein VFY49_18200, partial [Myxococcota bacterium]|nr:hypothetical protein [Myxococcota bacterium]